MKKAIVASAIACALVLAAEPATARLTEINVTAVEPFADGAAFGAAGAYERVLLIEKAKSEETAKRFIG